MLFNYKQNLQEIKNLDHLFNMLFIHKSDFNKSKFILAQKICYPILFQKALNNTSLKFVIDGGILKHKHQNRLKIALPKQIVLSTFHRLHFQGIHSVNTTIKSKLLQNFYIPLIMLNNCIKTAVNSCLNCSILHPSHQRKVIGMKRSLNEHLTVT